MCIENTIQQHIMNITNGGRTIADFFHATMQGEIRSVKVHHRMEAAKHLTRLALANTPSPLTGESRDGGENSEPYNSSFLRSMSLSPNREQESTLETADTAETQDNNPAHPVTDTDIINYEIARLIREETNDGYAIAEFLTRIMHGSSPGELAYSLRDRVISPADRMAAAKELLNRGFGRLGQTRRAARQDDSDLVRSGLARYIRERTDHGLEAARLLLDAASGEDDSFSMRQRVAATRELIRRGWDTNYEAVTPADIVAYYERQDAIEPTKYDNRLQEWQEQERAAQTAGARGADRRGDRPVVRRRAAAA